jgi:hypothetical protein
MVKFTRNMEHSMSKRFYFTISISILLAFAGIACKSAKSYPDLTADGITAETAWARITSEANYKKYSMWPSHSGVQPGQSPHGRFHKIFINDKLRDALPIDGRIAPVGSIVVKENYSPDKELGAYTIMIKVADYNPDNGDWFFAKYTVDGTAEVSGRLQKCADCHVGDNDYLMVHELDADI